jgi:hypothetical protein
VSRCCEKLVAEARGSWEPRGIRSLKPLPSNSSEDVTVDTRERESLYVCVCVCVCVWARETVNCTA